MKKEKQLNLKILKIPDDQTRDSVKIKSLCQIKGLECIGGIKRIDISHNNIEELECWEKLDGFEQIDLSFNQISDISPLINLQNMKILIINGNIIDFGQIQEFKKKRPDVKFDIEHVVVGDKKFCFESKINNVSIEKEIPGIDVGTVYRIQDIKGLGNYDNLYGLAMRGLEDFEGIEELTNLRALIVLDGALTEIKGFEGLKNLEILVLENLFRKCDLKPLRHLKNLRHLILGGYAQNYGTVIGKIEGLDNLKDLKNLKLSSNKISKIEGIKHLKNLEELWLRSNSFSNKLNFKRDIFPFLHPSLKFKKIKFLI